MALYALRFESGLPLASVHSTPEAALAQGAWDEFCDETRRVKDIIEIEEGEDPLGFGQGKSLVTREDVERGVKAAYEDLKRSQEPGSFHFLLSEDSWMNRKVG